jgi:hypothetical protein
MLDRLSRDGFPELAEGKVTRFQSFNVSKVSRCCCETLKLCHLETLSFLYLRMPSFVMTVL